MNKAKILVYAVLPQFPFSPITVEVSFMFVLRWLISTVLYFHELVNDFVVLVLKVLAVSLLCFPFVTWELNWVQVHRLSFVIEISFHMRLARYLSQLAYMQIVCLLLHVDVIDLAAALWIVHKLPIIFVYYIGTIISTLMFSWLTGLLRSKTLSSI
jgi:hypothetical protein